MENIVLNNKLECPVVGIETFMLSPADAEDSCCFDVYNWESISANWIC